MLVADDLGLIAVAGERRVHVGDGGHGLDHRVADDVGEAHLPLARATHVAVEDLAVDLEQTGRHRPHAGGGGDGQAGLHVLHDAGRRPADGFAVFARLCGLRLRLALGLGLLGGPLLFLGGLGCRLDWLFGRRRLLAVALVGEEVAPALRDRRRIGPVLLVHLVDEPRVGPESGVLLGHQFASILPVHPS